MPAGALRYLDDPPHDGRSVDHFAHYRAAEDIHFTSGIPNKAFHLMAVGGTHPVSLVTVAGIGEERAAHIWFRALTTRMTSNTSFVVAAAAMMGVAIDEYGDTSPEFQAVSDAWMAVGVLR
jgi:vibriolysin